jgi:hypothetical protein
LQHRQDDALFWSYLRSVDVTAENADLLSEYEELDVLGLRRSAGQQDQPEDCRLSRAMSPMTIERVCWGINARAICAVLPGHGAGNAATPFSTV